MSSLISLFIILCSVIRDCAVIMVAGDVDYSFELTGDFKAKLAELADRNNVISIDPLKANKSESACYFMYQLMQCSKNVSTMAESIGKLHETVNTLSNKVKDLETAANTKDEEIADLTRKLAATNEKLDTQQTEISHLLKRADKSDECNLELERHSRSSNLRVANIVETDNEDCKEKLVKVFSDLGVGEVDIENCHRVGSKQQGKTRCIIVRFVRRLERRVVLQKRKSFFDAGFPLYEDLPKKDLDTKKKFSKEISDLHKKKNKCYFSKGVWYVNGTKKFW